MESRIARKVDKYLMSFKTSIKDWISEKDEMNPVSRSEFLQFIFDFDSLNLSKEDFSKRKRIKNIVPCQTRCCARRANGERCTRRRKDDAEFCGTHIKGTPYGQIVEDISEPVICKKRNIWVQDIKGIQYFIDAENNVYSHEEIISCKQNPSIIATYTMTNGIYYIEQFYN